jgi:hypothetical protein
MPIRGADCLPFDIKTGDSAEETAQFLRRSIGEVREKVAEAESGPPMTLGNTAAAVCG